MPRVAHVISSPAGVGGAERVVASLVHGALERDWEVMVVNPFSRDPHSSALASICEPAPFAGRPCTHVHELPGLRRWLASVLGEFGPDIVHGHLFHAGVATASLRLPNGARSVFTHHHGDHLVYMGRETSARLDRWAGIRFDSVVAISEWVRRFLLESYRYPDRKVEMIRNGWEGEPLRRDGGRAPTVISVANFREQKGHRDLLSAFARVRTEIPSAQLVLIGEGELHDDLLEMTRRLGIADSVHFRGNVDDVWPELAAADLFALSSLYEPLGIAVMEAMAAGLPVVATAVGGVPELVRPGTDGILTPPADAEAMAAAVLRLLRDPDSSARMGMAGREAAEEMRSARSVDGYFNLYRALLAG